MDLKKNITTQEGRAVFTSRGAPQQISLKGYFAKQLHKKICFFNKNKL